MNRDELVLIALELNLSDILSLCLSNSTFNKYICDNDSFWKMKVYKDFGVTTTSKIAKEEYKRILVFREDMFASSIGGIPNGYDFLMSKYVEIFNEEFRKVFINVDPYKQIESFVDNFIDGTIDVKLYYEDRMFNFIA